MDVAPTRRAEVIASHSELLSLHCPRHPLLHALLPACADPQVFTRQDCPAYAREPLHTVGLLEAAHQYSLQDMGRSTRTPIPTALFTQEWQFKNLQSPMLFFAAQRLRRHGVKVQTGRQILLKTDLATQKYFKAFASASIWPCESLSEISNAFLCDQQSAK